MMAAIDSVRNEKPAHFILLIERVRQALEERMAIGSLIAWLTIATVAGFAAGGIVTRGHGFGTFGNIVIGASGSFVGGAIFPRLAPFFGSDIAGEIVSATVGGVILLLLFSASAVTLILMFGLFRRKEAPSRL
jgi:uncharacterized membrane protein YeaQ/YmgE (transglycosylase-associated protein family)